MQKFHINPQTGEPGACRAKAQCPFAEVSSHYESKDQARAVYERIQEDLAKEPKHLDINAASSEHYANAAYGSLKDFEVSTAVDAAYHGARYDNPEMRPVITLAEVTGKISDPEMLDRAISTPVYELERDKQVPFMLPPVMKALNNPALSHETFEKITHSVTAREPKNINDFDSKRPLMEKLMKDPRTTRKAKRTIQRFLTEG